MHRLDIRGTEWMHLRMQSVRRYNKSGHFARERKGGDINSDNSISKKATNTQSVLDMVQNAFVFWRIEPSSTIDILSQQ